MLKLLVLLLVLAGISQAQSRSAVDVKAVAKLERELNERVERAVSRSSDEHYGYGGDYPGYYGHGGHGGYGHGGHGGYGHGSSSSSSEERRPAFSGGFGGIPYGGGYYG